MSATIISLTVVMVALFVWGYCCSNLARQWRATYESVKSNYQKAYESNDITIAKLRSVIENLERRLASPAIPANPIAPDWTQPDVLALRNFLTKTETGVKLIQRGKALVSFTAVRACKDVMHTTHSAAQAGGMNEMINWLLSLASDEMHQKLSQPTGEQVEQQTSAQRPQSEAEFRELLSP